MEEVKGERSFFLEADEILDRLFFILSQWEGDFSPSFLSEVFEELFRSFHTLKGTAGSHGFPEITDLCHLLERLLSLARRRVKAIDEGFRLLIVDGLNSISLMLDSAARGDIKGSSEISGRIADEIKRLKKVRPAVSHLSRINEQLICSLTEGERTKLELELEEGRPIFRARFELPGKRMRSMLSLLEERLVPPLRKIALVPSAVAGGRVAVELFVSTSADYPVERLVKNFSTGGLSLSELIPFVTGKRRVLTQKGSATIRVEIARFDELLNRLGELMVEKETLRHRFAAVVKGSGFTPEVRGVEQVLIRLERSVSSLFDQMVAARMIPISQIFTRLKRQAGAIASQLGKRVKVVFEGGDTEVDGVLIERLSDPLIHLIRNAIDHGIEEVKVRRKRGKPEGGRITLSAKPEGGKIAIEVADDGGGINLARVRRKAEEQGLVEKGKKPGKEELLALIFKPGFSTREEMTEISGMGVGMDVVKERVEEFGGMVELGTKRGEGTRVKVVIPLTLANFKVLLARVDRFTFAFPLSAVVKGTRVNGSGLIREKKAGFYYTYQGKKIPIFSLRKELLKEDGFEERFVVVIEEWGKRWGLLVDSLVGQREVVVRPFPSLLSRIPGMVGAADCGEEKLALMVDLSFFARKV
jgi:two-component system chemotaxis sensor kinase CheA